MKKLLSVVLSIVMVLGMVMPMGVMAEETAEKDWIDFTGNSTIFMPYDTTEGSTYSDRVNLTGYIPGLDYGATVSSPTGVFETDKGKIYGNGEKMGVFVYTKDLNTEADRYAVPDFTTGADGKTYWNIEGVDYLVNPDQKAIKVVKNVSTATISYSTLENKDELAEKYQSLDRFVLDVEDGRYESISFLAGMVNNYSRKLYVELEYDNKIERKEIGVEGIAPSSNRTYKNGSVYFHRMNDADVKNENLDYHTFKPYTIEADKNATLKRVVLLPTALSATGASGGGYHYPIYIISAWRDVRTQAEVFADLDALADAGVKTEDDLRNINSAIAFIDEKYEALTEDEQTVYNKAKAAIEAGAFSVAKEKTLNEKYISYDFKPMFDMFATNLDFALSGWYNVTSTATEPNILAFKGHANRAYSCGQPLNVNSTGFKADELLGLDNVTYKDGHYNITVGGVPFKLGDIARDANQRGANAWQIRASYDPTAYSGDITLPAIPTEGDVAYSGTNNTSTGKFQINKAELSSMNLIMTNTARVKTANRLFHVAVKYEGESEQTGYIVSGSPIQTAIQNIYAVKVSDYNATKESTGTGKEKYAALNTAAVSLEEIMPDADLTKLSAIGATKPVAIPTSSTPFAPLYLRSTWSSTFNAHIQNVSYPLDSSKKVEYVKIIGNLAVDVQSLTETSGGYYDSGSFAGNLMLNYDGNSTVKVGEEEYMLYLQLIRECTDGILFGMTFEKETSYAERIAEVNAEIDAVSINTTTSEIEAIEGKIEALKAESIYVEDSDFKLAELEEKKELFAQEAERLDILSNKYTQLEMVGPWDMFATGDDIKDANWKVTSTAAAPNILAYKGWQQSSSGNIQPSANNIYAFRADMIEGTAINKNTDGRYYINIGSVPFKLGEIKTTAGERGANGWVPRGKLTPNTITEGLIPDIATTGDVTYAYGTGGYATNIMTGTFNINNKNISAINFLTTGVYYGASNNRLYDVYVKYEGEEFEEHGFMFAGNLTQSVEDAVFAIPAAKYNEIMADESLTSSMKELEAYTVDEINALRGYTPTTSVDTSKTITSKNYTLAQFNEALGLNLSKVPTSWIKDSTASDTTFYDIHKQIVAQTKYSAVTNDAVALSTLNAGLDTKKLSSAYTAETVAIPTESSSFVKYRRGNWNADYDTFVSYSKYPLDPNKKVESVRVEANLTDIKGDKGVAVGSGGAYSVDEYNTGRGVMMLNYNGQKTVNIGGTDYVLFMKVQRECGDSMFLGATYERKSTIKEEIDDINARIDAIDENTKVSEIIALREQINSLKAESQLVADKDFALADLEAAEETLSERKIKEATDAMTAITLDSTIEEANAAKDLYDYALEDANVTESSFDAGLVALFNEIHAKIADKTNLKGTISVKYFKGETPSAEVVIENATKFAGKPYKVVFAYYDADENLLGTYIEDRTSVKAEKEVFTVKTDKDFENATKVKAFIWKDFATILPLSNVEEVAKKDAFKILSIGNSFSNNAHTYLGEIAQSAGFERIIIENLYIGGCTLDKHYSNLSANSPAYTLYHKELVDGEIVTTTTGNVTMLEGIKNQDWDVITIQQGSSHSAKADKFTYLQDIIDYVNEHKTNPDAKIAWHMTWSYKDGSDNLISAYPGMTQMDMYNAIINAVETKVLTADGIDFVIPAGTAVQNARVPLGDTMNSDNIHLNNVANYLIGLVWFEKITGISLDTITYTPDNATIKDNLATLKKAAKDSLANPYAVTK